MGRSSATEKTKCVLKPVKQWEQRGNMHNWKFRNFLNKNHPSIYIFPITTSRQYYCLWPYPQLLSIWMISEVKIKQSYSIASEKNINTKSISLIRAIVQAPVFWRCREALCLVSELEFSLVWICAVFGSWTPRWIVSFRRSGSKREVPWETLFPFSPWIQTHAVSSYQTSL